MSTVALRWLKRFVLVLVCTVVGSVMAILSVVGMLPKILKNPRKALTKKKRNLPPPAYLNPSWGQHHSVQCNGIQLYYVAAGDPEKPLMLFLHGFPECWYSWRHQLRYFSENYRVVAPDMRGYGRSSRPSSSVFDYHPDKLAKDVRCFIQALGYEKCVLVAHDWGGLVAWVVAERYQSMVDRLIVMDCPHLAVYEDFSWENKSQLVRSKYILLFYVWYIPEFIMSLYDWGFVGLVFAGKQSGVVNKERMTEDDLEVFKWSISRRGAATAALNYYRCLPSLSAPLFAPSFASRKASSLTVPTLVLWGENDTALDCKMAKLHDKVCEDLTVRVIPSCSHWIQQDQPDVTNQIMRAWLEAKESGSSSEAKA